MVRAAGIFFVIFYCHVYFVDGFYLQFLTPINLLSKSSSIIVSRKGLLPIIPESFIFLNSVSNFLFELYQIVLKIKELHNEVVNWVFKGAR